MTKCEVTSNIVCYTFPVELMTQRSAFESDCEQNGVSKLSSETVTVRGASGASALVPLAHLRSVIPRPVSIASIMLRIDLSGAAERAIFIRAHRYVDDAVVVNRCKDHARGSRTVQFHVNVSLRFYNAIS